MLSLPGDVLPILATFLTHYADIRRVLWTCNDGNTLISRIRVLTITGHYTRRASGGRHFDYDRFINLQEVGVTLLGHSWSLFYELTRFLPRSVKKMTLRLGRGTTHKLDLYLKWLEEVNFLDLDALIIVCDHWNTLQYDIATD